MSDPPHSPRPWIAPELEARLAALVLGEASDFEKDELERLIGSRAELGLYRQRLAVVHAMLRKVAQGEATPQAEQEWKLGPERRAVVLAGLGQAGAAGRPPAKPKRGMLRHRTLLNVAAGVVLLGVVAGLMFPASTGVLRSSKLSRSDAAAFHDAAYDHTRSRMIEEVAVGWESPVPSSGPEINQPVAPPASPAVASPSQPGVEDKIPYLGDLPVADRLFGSTGETSTAAAAERRVAQSEQRVREEKLKSIVLPSVEFIDTPLDEALAYLEKQSVELDKEESDPAKKGVKIALDVGLLETPAASGDGFGFESPKGESSAVADTKITLRLKDVPLAEALRYTSSLAQLKYKVDAEGVDILPLSTPDADLFTNVYQVPDSFVTLLSKRDEEMSAAADPFADPVSAGGGGAIARSSARNLLEASGISFPTGSSVTYNPETSQLIVRNSADQMELVEALVESINPTPAAAVAPAEKPQSPITESASGFAIASHGGVAANGEVGRLGATEQKREIGKSVQDIIDLTPQLGQLDISGNDRTKDQVIRRELPVEIGELLTKAKEQPSGVVTFGAGVPFLKSGSGFLDVTKLPLPAALNELSPTTEPFSTFSLHVSDVSFQLAQAALAAGQWPEAEKIRIEEFVNAFDYGDPTPAMDERVSCRIDQAAHPFLQQRNLVRIALRTSAAGRSAETPLRLTILLDSSGSMERPDRRATVRRAFATLAGLLGENDRITLITFARQPRLIADAVPGNEATTLAETVAHLPSEGGTNLEAALQLGFEKAREHFEASAQNRIVLLTDGATNLGDADAATLATRVIAMREAGLAFDAAGFGADGVNDEVLEALTRNGDGRYYLLDRPEDAEASFAQQIAGALRPSAKNVKVQIEFDPARVKSYRLLGFEKHRLNTEDFRNDAVDAAELAAAEAGVAVYQVEPDPSGTGDLGSVSVRFRDLETDTMIERRWVLPYAAGAPRPEQGASSTLLATVASQFAAKLAGGPLGDVVDLAELARLAAELPDAPRVAELRTMIEQARGLEGGR